MPHQVCILLCDEESSCLRFIFEKCDNTLFFLQNSYGETPLSFCIRLKAFKNALLLVDLMIEKNVDLKKVMRDLVRTRYSDMDQEFMFRLALRLSGMDQKLMSRLAFQSYNTSSNFEFEEVHRSAHLAIVLSINLEEVFYEKTGLNLLDLLCPAKCQTMASSMELLCSSNPLNELKLLSTELFECEYIGPEYVHKFAESCKRYAIGCKLSDASNPRKRPMSESQSREELLGASKMPLQAHKAIRLSGYEHRRQ